MSLQVLSLREAAVLLNASEKSLRNELDRVLQVRGAPANGGRSQLRFGVRELAYFEAKQLLESQGVSLDPEQRRELFQLLTRRRTHALGAWSLVGSRLALHGQVEITMNMEKAWSTLFRTVRSYARGEALIEQRSDIMGGTSVFRGTRIPVQQVVDYFRNEGSVEEAREDFPTLSEDTLLYARIQAAAGPGPGRPAKRISFTAA